MNTIDFTHRTLDQIFRMFDQRWEYIDDIPSVEPQWLRASNYLDLIFRKSGLQLSASASRKDSRLSDHASSSKKLQELNNELNIWYRETYSEEDRKKAKLAKQHI